MEKKKKLRAKVGLILGLMIFAFFALGSSSGSDEKSDVKNAAEGKNTVVDNRDSGKKSDEDIEDENDNNETDDSEVVEETKEPEFSEDEVEIVGEYLYENLIGSSLYFVVVKNNSQVDISVEGQGTATDVDGNKSGVDDMDITIIGPGETSIGYFYFSDVTAIESVDYSLTYNTHCYYTSVINNLSVEQNLNEQNVTLTLTNEGNTVAEFVEAYALFFNAENEIIRYESTYIGDSNSEIKPGATLSGQLDSYKGYDHVEVYFTARSDGKVVEVSEADKLVSQFDVQEYSYENSIGTTLWFLVITNNSEATKEVNANGVAKDVDGNVIGADDLSIDVLGPGESTVAYFYFDNVSSIDHVEYQLSLSDSYYKPVISNISVDQSINDKNVIVTLTNEGKRDAMFVEAHALFFDADNNIIGHDSQYVIDDDSELKAGATLSEQLDMYGKKFDHVEVYISGRAR